MNIRGASKLAPPQQGGFQEPGHDSYGRSGDTSTYTSFQHRKNGEAYGEDNLSLGKKARKRQRRNQLLLAQEEKEARERQELEERMSRETQERMARKTKERQEKEAAEREAAERKAAMKIAEKGAQKRKGEELTRAMENPGSDKKRKPTGNTPVEIRQLIKMLEDSSRKNHDAKIHNEKIRSEAEEERHRQRALDPNRADVRQASTKEFGSLRPGPLTRVANLQDLPQIAASSFSSRPARTDEIPSRKPPSRSHSPEHRSDDSRYERARFSCSSSSDRNRRERRHLNAPLPLIREAEHSQSERPGAFIPPVYAGADHPPHECQHARYDDTRNCGNRSPSKRRYEPARALYGPQPAQSAPRREFEITESINTNKEHVSVATEVKQGNSSSMGDRPQGFSRSPDPFLRKRSEQPKGLRAPPRFTPMPTTAILRDPAAAHLDIPLTSPPINAPTGPKKGSSARFRAAPQFSSILTREATEPPPRPVSVSSEAVSAIEEGIEIKVEIPVIQPMPHQQIEELAVEAPFDPPKRPVSQSSNQPVAAPQIPPFYGPVFPPAMLPLYEMLDWEYPPSLSDQWPVVKLEGSERFKDFHQKLTKLRQEAQKRAAAQNSPQSLSDLIARTTALLATAQQNPPTTPRTPHHKRTFSRQYHYHNHQNIRPGKQIDFSPVIMTWDELPNIDARISTMTVEFEQAQVANKELVEKVQAQVDGYGDEEAVIEDLRDEIEEERMRYEGKVAELRAFKYRYSGRG
ncbi:MAG: hypothetical protein MMC33_002771 [Icmadophila ericetorum]|nr:hypothetical protein [Icmadophila ericetorum]